MSVSGKYEKYTCCTGGDKIKTQSIVECRLNDWSEKKILAVGAKAVLGGAEVLSGEIRYGGKLYFTIVAAEEDGAIIGAERGAEFSHKAPCESAAPAQTADVVLRVEKTEIRRDGRAVVLSAIVSAEIELFVPAEIDYLSGGEGIVCDFAPVRVLQVFTARGEAEIEEEFDTDYVGDVLMHSECAFVNRAVSVAGGVEVSGEINLGILAKKEGENDVVSFERLIPFRAEIPCDEAVTGAGATAIVEVRSVNISASCDEDKNRCRVFAEFVLEVHAKVYRGENVVMPKDAFCLGCKSAPEKREIESREPTCSFSASERVSGTAAMSGQIDFSCSLQAVALTGCEVAAGVGDGEVNVEGVVFATVLYKEGGGAPASCQISLPFAFPVKSDRARRGDTAEVSALVCGVSARQKKEGELEADGALKLYITLFSGEKHSVVTRIEAGEPIAENDSAFSVYIPAAGDGLWDVAKKLRKTPEEVQRCNADLEYPLTGKERIVIYRKKQVKF